MSNGFIALCLSSAWPQYYASSPFLNLLRSQHRRFRILPALPHETLNEEYRAQVNECEALVVDDVLAPFMDFYSNGPKLMVGGDSHAHRPDQVERLEKEYASVDYVLSNGYFALKHPIYLYPSDEARQKHLVFPHTVPDAEPPPSTWYSRRNMALLSGNTAKEVYPYRARARELGDTGAPIHTVPLGKVQHSDYFNLVGQYQMAITCTSILKCTLAKHFEIPWCGSLLITPPACPLEMEVVGFEPGDNMILCHDPEDLPKLIQDISHDSAAYEMVAFKGARFMQENHTAHRRLDYVAALIDKIKAGRVTGQDSVDVFISHRKGEL